MRLYLELPALFTHGSEDNITLADSSSYLAEKVSGEKLILYCGRDENTNRTMT
jgi:hypothetical protein